MGATNVFTQTITGTTLSISSADNVFRFSVICNSGTVTMSGNARFQGMASNVVTFTFGEGATIQATSLNNPLDGITVDATSGEAEIIISN
jgi:hypothetical protein